MDAAALITLFAPCSTAFWAAFCITARRMAALLSTARFAACTLALPRYFWYSLRFLPAALRLRFPPARADNAKLSSLSSSSFPARLAAELPLRRRYRSASSFLLIGEEKRVFSPGMPPWNRAEDLNGISPADELRNRDRAEGTASPPLPCTPRNRVPCTTDAPAFSLRNCTARTW